MNQVIITTKEGISIQDFENPVEAAVFHNKQLKNPDNLSVLVNFELMELTENFLKPRVKSFSGQFFNDIFVGSFVLEDWNGSKEEHEGAISVHEVDFHWINYEEFKKDREVKISSLQLAGCRKIGFNEDTEQTFLIYQDQLIAVDAEGNIAVSTKVSTWNESIDELLYTEKF
jgi:hypothetical protein